MENENGHIVAEGDANQHALANCEPLQCTQTDNCFEFGYHLITYVHIKSITGEQHRMCCACERIGSSLALSSGMCFVST